MGNCDSTQVCKANPGTAQCSNNFNCDGINTVCVQYPIFANNEKQSVCTAGCDQNGIISGNTVACNGNVIAPDGSHIVDPGYQWASGQGHSENCCAAACSKVDFSRCNNIVDNWGPGQYETCGGEVGGNFSELKVNKNPNDPASSRKTLNVTCKWDVTLFNNVNTIKKYKEQFGSGGTCKNPPCPQGGTNNVYNEIIMPYFCSLPVKNKPGQLPICPAQSPAGAWVGDECSPMVAIRGEEATLCQNWIIGLKTLTEKTNANEKVFNGYCKYLQNKANQPGADPNLLGGEINECVCINRKLGGNNGLYNEVINAAAEGGYGANTINSLGAVGCWYGPCNASPKTQLIPLNVPGETNYYPTSCPNVCKIVSNINGTITNSKINNIINCNGYTQPPGTQPQPPGTQPQPPGTQPPRDTTDKSFWDKYKWWIIGIGGGIILLIIIIIICL